MNQQIGCIIEARNVSAGGVQIFGLISGDCIGTTAEFPLRWIGIAPSGFNSRTDRWLVRIVHVDGKSVEIQINTEMFERASKIMTIEVGVPFQLHAADGSAYSLLCKEIKPLFV